MDFLKTGLGVASAVALTLVLSNHPEILTGSSIAMPFSTLDSARTVATNTRGTSTVVEIDNTYLPPYSARVATGDSPDDSGLIELLASDSSPLVALSNSQRRRMSPPAAKLAESGSERLVDVIVAYQSWRDLLNADRVIALDGELKRSFSRSGLQVIRLPALRLADVSLERNVKMIALLEPA